jgi:molecular chaperone DnaK
MVKEAEDNAEEDRKRKENIELRNKAEGFIADIDLALQEKGETMDPAQKEQTQKLRDELKTALDNNDMETIKKRIDELEKAAAFMQQQAQTGGNGGDSGAANGADGKTPGTNPDDVVDADFTGNN